MRQVITTIATACALALVAVGLLTGGNAEASPGDVRPRLEEPEAPSRLKKVALAAPIGVVKEFNVSCTTSATAIRAASGDASQDYKSVYCQNENTTPVTIGSSTVVTGTGPRICNDSACVRADFPADVRGLYCIAGTATTIKCLAGVK